MQIILDHSLRDHNTFAIDVKCKYFIRCHSVEDLFKLSRDEYFRILPYLIMGGGSNLLFTSDIDGAIVHYEGAETQVVEETDTEITLRVGAGLRWDAFVERVCREGLWGVENLSWIPGDIGAAAAQNIGAYGSEICEVVSAVHAFDLSSGQSVTFSTQECRYAYRYSVFKERRYHHYLIYAVDIVLQKKGSANLSYFRGYHPTSPSPMDIRKHVIGVRQAKLPDPAILPNSGSFFTNPFVTVEKFDEIRRDYPEVPHFHLEDGCVKIPAAWLIEQAGYRGKDVNGVGCFERQPLVIVKRDAVSGSDIVAFSHEVQAAILQKFGISLVPEVRIVTLDDLIPLDL